MTVMTTKVDDAMFYSNLGNTSEVLELVIFLRDIDLKGPVPPTVRLSYLQGTVLKLSVPSTVTPEIVSPLRVAVVSPQAMPVS